MSDARLLEKTSTTNSTESLLDAIDAVGTAILNAALKGIGSAFSANTSLIKVRGEANVEDNCNALRVEASLHRPGVQIGLDATLVELRVEANPDD